MRRSLCDRVIRAWSTAGIVLCVGPALSFGQEPAGLPLTLPLPAGARAGAIGMAHGAVAEGPDAGYWNPAALAFIESRNAVNFTYSEEGGFDRTLPFVFTAYAARTPKLNGAVALSFAYFDFGEATDLEGEDYRPYELAPAIAYGGRLNDELAIGLGFKMYRIDYTSPNADPENEGADNTFLLDGGILWRRADSRVLIGGSVQNLGPDLELGTSGTSFPPARNVKIALGATVVENSLGQLLTAFDLNIPIAGEDNGPRLMAGGEMRVGDHAAMRIGIRYDGWFVEENEFTDELDKYATTLGFGARFKGFSFDYANAPWTVFSDNAHFFTVGGQF